MKALKINDMYSTIKNYNDKEKQINMPESTKVTGETRMTRMTEDD